jgi:hypothetical protein
MSEIKFMEGCDTRHASWERSKRFLESYHHKISRYYALLTVFCIINGNHRFFRGSRRWIKLPKAVTKRDQT